MSTLVNRPRLHTPLHLGRLELPNRIVMPPLVVWKAPRTAPSRRLILEHYRESAGPGLVIVEATVVSPEGRLAREQIGIFEDRHVEGLARIASVIHAAGAVASIQLHHAGRNTNLENTFGAAARGAVGRPREGHRARGAERGRHRAHPRVLRRGRAPGRGGRLRRRGDPRRARLPREPVPVAARQPAGRPVGRQPGEPGPVRARGGAADARGRRRTSARVVPARGRGRASRAGCRSTRASRSRGGWKPTACRSSTYPRGSAAQPKLAPQGGPWSDRLLLGAAVKKAVRIPGDRRRRHHRPRPGRARAGRGTRRRSWRSGARCSRTRSGR